MPQKQVSWMVISGSYEVLEFWFWFVHHVEIGATKHNMYHKLEIVNVKIL